MQFVAKKLLLRSLCFLLLNSVSSSCLPAFVRDKFRVPIHSPCRQAKPRAARRSQICFTAWLIASAMRSRCPPVCCAEIAVRIMSLPGGTAGAIDMTVKTPFSRSARQKRYTRSLPPRTIGIAGVSLPHVSRPSARRMSR